MTCSATSDRVFAWHFDELIKDIPEQDVIISKNKEIIINIKVLTNINNLLRRRERKVKVAASDKMLRKIAKKYKLQCLQLHITRSEESGELRKVSFENEENYNKNAQLAGRFHHGTAHFSDVQRCFFSRAYYSNVPPNFGAVVKGKY